MDFIKSIGLMELIELSESCSWSLRVKRFTKGCLGGWSPD